MRIDKVKIRYPTAENNSQELNQANRPSVFTMKHKGEFYNIEINKLFPFHKQARKFFDEDALNKMADTIKIHGIRQPLTVIPIINKPGEYEVVSGERRLKAAKIAGLETVPCIIIYDSQAAVEIALIENVQREDLHPIELAKAYQQLIDEKVCNNKVEIAEKLGVSKSSVTETIKLLSLPETIQSILIRHNITTRSVFRDIFNIENQEKMKDYLLACSRPKKKSAAKHKTTIFKIVKIGDSFLVEQEISKEKDPIVKQETKERILKILQDL